MGDEEDRKRAVDAARAAQDFRASRQDSEPTVEEYEMDDNGVIRPVNKREPPEWTKDPQGRMEYEAQNRLKPVLSPEQKAALDSRIAGAQARTDAWAAGQMQKTVGQLRAQPGGEYGAQKGMEFAQGARGAIGKVVEAVTPKTRDIAQIQREFSNEQEKAAYLERVKKAMENASKK